MPCFPATSTQREKFSQDARNSRPREDREVTRMQHFRLQSSTLVPALTCSLAAAYLVSRLRLKQRRDRTTEVDGFKETEESTDDLLQLRETDAHGMQQIQQMMVEIVGHLSVKDAFFALPAASKWMQSTFHEVRLNIRQGVLWPMAFPPETGESQLSSLEVLFLWSISSTWVGSPHVLPHRSLVAAGVHATNMRPVRWALQQCGWEHRGAKILRNIFQWKANPDELDVNRWTPLIWAAHRGSVSVCRELLHARANPDHIGAEGSSALSVACRSAHRYTVQLLLMEGASPFLVPIGNGNFDHHVGEDILEMVRQYRHMCPRKKEVFVMSSR